MPIWDLLLGISVFVSGWCITIFNILKTWHPSRTRLYRHRKKPSVWIHCLGRKAKQFCFIVLLIFHGHAHLHSHWLKLLNHQRAFPSTHMDEARLFLAISRRYWRPWSQDFRTPADRTSWVSIHTCSYSLVLIQQLSCMYVCMCVYVCMYVCMYVYIYICSAALPVPPFSKILDMFNYHRWFFV